MSSRPLKHGENMLPVMSHEHHLLRFYFDLNLLNVSTFRCSNSQEIDHHHGYVSVSNVLCAQAHSSTICHIPFDLYCHPAWAPLKWNSFCVFFAKCVWSRAGGLDIGHFTLFWAWYVRARRVEGATAGRNARSSGRDAGAEQVFAIDKVQVLDQWSGARRLATWTASRGDFSRSLVC